MDYKLIILFRGWAGKEFTNW